MNACNVRVRHLIVRNALLEIPTVVRHRQSGISRVRQCLSRQRSQQIPSRRTSPTTLYCSPVQLQDHIESSQTPESESERKLAGQRQAGHAARMLIALAVFTTGCALLNPSEAVASAVAASPSTVSPLAGMCCYVQHISQI